MDISVFDMSIIYAVDVNACCVHRHDANFFRYLLNVTSREKGNERVFRNPFDKKLVLSNRKRHLYQNIYTIIMIIMKENNELYYLFKSMQYKSAN